VLFEVMLWYILFDLGVECIEHTSKRCIEVVGGSWLFCVILWYFVLH